MEKNIVKINENTIRKIVAESVKKMLKESNRNGFEMTFLEYLNEHDHCIGDPGIDSPESAAKWYNIYVYIMQKWNHFKQSWEKEGYDLDNFLETEFCGHFDPDSDSDEDRYDDEAIKNGTYPF